jgi:putative ATPase
MYREKDEADYLYSHNYPENISGQSYLEKDLSLFMPKSAGAEKRVAERLDYWQSPRHKPL